MTSTEAVNKLISVAESQVGYLEKESNKNLDSFTGNAGDENYTKYNRDLKQWTGVGYIAAQWCQAFVDWCFIKAFGVEGAKQLIYVFTNYTPTGSDAFKKRGRYIKRGKGKPKRGDVIYFYSSAKGRIGHVGIVYKVSSSTVYTIEGNTSGASSLVTNGGGVKKKSYSLSSTYIDGYGSVDYSNVTGEPIKDEPRILENGCEGADVKALQEKLIKAGYSCGKWGADGEFGDQTEMAVRRFQTQQGLVVDGQVGEKTLEALDKLLAAQNVEPAKPKYVLISGGNCYVRSEPRIGNNIRGVALEDSRLTYSDKKEGKWLSVVYKDAPGWVSDKYGKLVE